LLLGKVSCCSRTAAAAIRYASSRWQALTGYVDDGQLEIDSPPNARCASPSDEKLPLLWIERGTERAAAIYSLLGSAKLNKLDRKLYLHQVLEQIAYHSIRPDLRTVAMEPRRPGQSHEGRCSGEAEEFGAVSV
jgi:hypothetical protein